MNDGQKLPNITFYLREDAPDPLKWTAHAKNPETEINFEIAGADTAENCEHELRKLFWALGRHFKINSAPVLPDPILKTPGEILGGQMAAIEKLLPAPMTVTESAVILGIIKGETQSDSTRARNICILLGLDLDLHHVTIFKILQKCV